jgi:hypothetical protein
MLGRRFLLLVAVLMGLTALAASLAPREPLLRDGGRSAATPTPTPQSEPGTPVKTVERTISTTKPQRITVTKGELVQLTVTGDEVDTVQLLDEIEPIEADSPALFELLADTPGSYPIQLVDADRQIGTLVVR